MDKGKLIYEYNMMIIENYKAESGVIPAGKHQIIVDTQLESAKPMAPAIVTVAVDGKEVAKTVSQSYRAGRVYGQRVIRCRR
jgi:hypothetical protein